MVLSQRFRCFFFKFRFRAKIVTWHVFKYSNQKVASDVSSLVLGWSLAFKAPGFIRDYKKGILSLQNSPLDIICSVTYVFLCVCCRWRLTFLLAVWWSIPERIISTAHEYLNMIGIYQALLLSNRISVIHGSRINWETLCCPQFRTCGRDKPSHMTQNLVTVGAKW